MKQNRLIEGVKGAKPVCNQLQPLVTQNKPILNICTTFQLLIFEVITLNILFQYKINQQGPEQYIAFSCGLSSGACLQHIL